MDHEAPDLPRRSGASNPPTRLLLVMIGLVSAVLTTGTAASVYVAGDPARRAGTEGKGIVHLRANVHSDTRQVRALIDSLVEPMGVLPMDSSMIRRSVALLTAPRDSVAWISIDTKSIRILDTLHFLREWARREPMPTLWGYRTGFGNPGDAAKLPIRRLMVVKELATRNEASADSALLAGDANTAMTRARELLAGSRHLIEEPRMLDMLIGRYLVQRGARLLQRSAQQGDEPMIAGAAKRLADLGADTYTISRDDRLAMNELATAPEDGRLVEVARDRRLPASIRTELTVLALMRGACIDTREMIFGASKERRVAFEQIIAAVEDIPRMEEMSPLRRKQFEDFNSPGDWVRGIKVSGQKESILMYLVPSIVRKRVQYCRMVV